MGARCSKLNAILLCGIAQLPIAAFAAQPIIDDKSFEEALPQLDAPPMESIEEWQKAQDAREQAEAPRAEADELLAEPSATDAPDGSDAVAAEEPAQPVRARR